MNENIFKGTPKEFFEERDKKIMEKILSNDSWWSISAVLCKALIFDIKYGILTLWAKWNNKRTKWAYNKWLKKQVKGDNNE